MTAIVQPSDPTEQTEFENWSDAIAKPPSGSSESQEAVKAATWILDDYLTKPGRETYRQKVSAWAQSDMVLFGKVGTVVGANAASSTDMECVGYWQEGQGSTMAWYMTLQGGGQGRYLFAGQINASLQVTALYLFDVTGVTLPENPSTAVLKTNDRWAQLAASPAYSTLLDIVAQIESGKYTWPNN